VTLQSAAISEFGVAIVSCIVCGITASFLRASLAESDSKELGEKTSADNAEDNKMDLQQNGIS
jgi:hypothetical protein